MHGFFEERRRRNAKDSSRGIEARRRRNTEPTRANVLIHCDIVEIERLYMKIRSKVIATVVLSLTMFLPVLLYRHLINSDPTLLTVLQETWLGWFLLCVYVLGIISTILTIRDVWTGRIKRKPKMEIFSTHTQGGAHE